MVQSFQFWKKPKVREETALSDSERDRRIAAGRFPQPIYLGPKTVVWRSDQIDRWKRLIASGKDWTPEVEAEFSEAS